MLQGFMFSSLLSCIFNRFGSSHRYPGAYDIN